MVIITIIMVVRLDEETEKASRFGSSESKGSLIFWG